MINTKFWDDDYTSNLDPIEKLMFLYLLTNTSTNISGIYEIPLKKIAMETGIDKEMVIKVIDRFSKDQKVFYQNGWICMKNFVKNQNQRSPKVITGIKNELNAVPKDILDVFVGFGYGIDTLSHLIQSNLTKSNLTKVSDKVAEKKEKDPISEIIKAFEVVDPKNKTYYGNRTQRASTDFLLSEYGMEKVLQAIKILPLINQKKLYLRQITTPYELKENWVKIRNAIKQNNLSTKSRIIE